MTLHRSVRMQSYGNRRHLSSANTRHRSRLSTRFIARTFPLPTLMWSARPVGRDTFPDVPAKYNLLQDTGSDRSAFVRQMFNTAVVLIEGV